MRRGTTQLLEVRFRLQRTNKDEWFVKDFKPVPADRELGRDGNSIKWIILTRPCTERFFGTDFDVRRVLQFGRVKIEDASEQKDPLNGSKISKFLVTSCTTNSAAEKSHRSQKDIEGPVVKDNGGI